MNDPLTITATRNPGCTNPITWTVSPATEVEFENNTDSTISFKFNKSGVYQIKAAINVPCADSIRDRITIHVNLSDKVQLGTDTLLCPGTTLVLHAGTQFRSYTWQDGSRDSDYTVTSAGKYYVTVTGFCNEALSDTINIAVAAAYDFSGTNDTSICKEDSLTLVAKGGFTGYKWFPDYNMVSDSGQKVIVFPSTDTSYLVTALSPEGCRVKDTVRISIYHSQPLFLGNDTSFCNGQSLVLKAPGKFDEYHWNNGSSAPDITIDSPGMYALAATASNGCISKDTLIVNNVYDLPEFSLGNDTSLCENQSLNYNFALPGAHYLWNDGTTSSVHHLTKNGTYWLQVSQNGCTKRDTLQLSYNPLPVVNLGKDTTLCEGIIMKLDVHSSGATYLWQDNSMNPDYTVSKDGVYFATVTINNCSTGDTIAINYTKKPFFTFNEKPFICNGQKVKLSPVINSANKYVWQDNSTEPSLLIDRAGTFTLTVSNECGSFSNSITVVQGDCQLYMPNAFTPNNDGLNDLFRVKYPQFIKLFHMTIFNRFGEKVFETNNPSDGWDGKLKSVDQQVGVYVWIINLTDNDRKASFFKGIVSLIR
jgi:gliding motility-associated-like protein